MIKPSDIAVSVEPHETYPHQRVRAGLKMSMEQFTGGNSSEEIERLKDRCKREIWHHVYGDIIREVQAVEREVCQLLTIGSYHTASAAFKRLNELLDFKEQS